jgi:hypothetical protein
MPASRQESRRRRKEALTESEIPKKKWSLVASAATVKNFHFVPAC